MSRGTRLQTVKRRWAEEQYDFGMGLIGQKGLRGMRGMKEG